MRGLDPLGQQPLGSESGINEEKPRKASQQQAGTDEHDQSIASAW